MDKFPIFYEGRMIGELMARQEGEDTLFSAHFCLPEKDLWCLWAVGQDGTLRLGCPEQPSGEVVLSRRFSRRMTAPLGRLRHAELRKAAQQNQCGWEKIKDPQQLFRAQWLRQALQGKKGVLTRKQGPCRLIALPFSLEKPFPLISLFCFAAIRELQEGKYAVFTFNAEEWPVIGNF